MLAGHAVRLVCARFADYGNAAQKFATFPRNTQMPNTAAAYGNEYMSAGGGAGGGSNFRGNAGSAQHNKYYHCVNTVVC